MERDNSDYKYILNSFTLIQIGARWTYQELLDNVDLSYKFRCIIKQIILKEVDQDTTLESHFYYLSPDSETCRALTSLKAKIRLYVPEQKKHRSGSIETLFEEKTMSPEMLASYSPEQKKTLGFQIFELQLSKVGLMTFVI